jgi:hypothetical protein
MVSPRFRPSFRHTKRDAYVREEEVEKDMGNGYIKQVVVKNEGEKPP